MNKKFKCKECDRIFESESGLNSHNYAKHGIEFPGKSKKSLGKRKKSHETKQPPDLITKHYKIEKNKKKLFKIVLLYLRMIYGKRGSKNFYLRLVTESKKTNKNYSVLDNVPRKYVEQAIRYRFPLVEDYIFGLILFVSPFIANYFFDISAVVIESYLGEGEILGAMVGITGISYGLLFALIPPLRDDGPRILSIKYIIDRRFIMQTLANIATFGFFWILLYAAMIGLYLTIMVGNLGYLGLVVLGLTFPFIYYKLRHSKIGTYTLITK